VKFCTKALRVILLSFFLELSEKWLHFRFVPMKKILRFFSETVGRFESKERLVKASILRNGMNDLPSS
jgi:hypothetical protein